jgi:hypothetical protein
LLHFLKAAHGWEPGIFLLFIYFLFTLPLSHSGSTFPDYEPGLGPGRLDAVLKNSPKMQPNICFAKINTLVLPLEKNSAKLWLRM